MLLTCCGFAKGQTIASLPPDTIKPDWKIVSSTVGPVTSVRTILQDEIGNFWFACNDGIIRYDGKLFTNITGTLTNYRFFAALQDRKGNFWFATNGTGVYYYDGKTFLHFTTKQGLANDQVTAICEDKAGNIWFGANGAVSRYDGNSFRNFNMQGSSSSNNVNAILEDKTGKLWFGTRGYTYLYDGTSFSIFTAKGYEFTNVWSIIEDAKGNIWLGGGRGLWRYDGKTFTSITCNGVNYVYEDSKGNIWTTGTTDKGKFVFSRFDLKSLSDKVPTVKQLATSLNLFGIFEANDGSIWFGAYDGVYRYDGQKITGFKN